MKGFKSFCLLLWGFLLFPAAVSAQNVAFEVNAPEVVAIGEVFQVEFVTDTKPKNFIAPAFEGMDLLAGPSSSISTNTVVANGNMEQTRKYTYTYVLQCNTEGEFTIPAAAIEVGRETYRTKPVTIKAINQPAAANSPSGGNAVLAPDDVLLIASVNKSRVFKGEPVRVTFKLYYNKPMANVQLVKMPAFNGFWSQQLDVESYRGRRREEYKGKIYESWVVAEYLLFPQMAGTLTVDPMSLTAIVQIITQQRSQSIFDDFFGSPDIQEVSKPLTTEPIRIQVNELPSGAPASFNGAVGEFELSHELPSSSIAANSAVTYNIRLSGNGNLQQVQAPKLTLPSSFEQYTIKTTETLDNSREGVYGYRQFEYPFIARAVGEYDIPPVEFSYFNPGLARYVTLSSPGMRMQVLPDSVSLRGGEGAIVSGLSKEDIKILGRDIRFIKLGPANLHSQGMVFMWSGLYFAIMLTIVGLFVFLLVWLRKYLADRRNSALIKGKYANKVALMRFRAAEDYMKADNQRGFYEEMLKALWGYMGDKLNIPVANLTKENIREELMKKGVSADHASRYIVIIGECEYAQYAPAASGRMHETYSAGVEIVSKLESVIGKQA